MPAHTLGVAIPGSLVSKRSGVTYADVWSVIMTILFYWQPGVDHQAVMQWIVDHAFFGSIAACSIAGTFFSHKLLEWGGMAFFAALYYLEGCAWFPFAKTIARAKIDPNTPWDWNATDVRLGQKYVALQTKSIWYIIKYHAIVCLVQFVIFTSAIQYTWSEGRFTWSWIEGHPELQRANPATIPSKATVAWQCMVSTIVAESGFYFAHRLLHETRLYYWHKRHHEYKDSTVYATFYVGLLDSIITDFIPAGFGIVYFEMHQWTVFMFTLPLIANALRVHGGYDNSKLLPFLGFSPSVTLPLCTDAERTHDMHHRYNNCNYGGAYFVLDRLFGTWMDPDQEVADKAAGRPVQTPKATKQYVPAGEKAEGAVQPIDDTTDVPVKTTNASNKKKA